MYNVSFSGAKVGFNPSKFIKDAKASELAEAIKIGVKKASKETGKVITHPHGERLSGALLREVNQDAFEKTTQVLTEKGKKGFNNIYGRQFGLTVDKKLKDLVNCAQDVAKKTADDTGRMTYGFKYMI